MKIRIDDCMQFKGHVRLTATDPATKKILAIIDVDNLVVTVGKELVGRMLIDEAGYDTGLTYCAIGTGAAAPLITDTQLATEAARKIITSRTRAANVITLSTFLTVAESTFNIKEAGIFGHSTATGVANSGDLFARALLSYDNTGATADITIDWVITLG